MSPGLLFVCILIDSSSPYLLWFTALSLFHFSPLQLPHKSLTKIQLVQSSAAQTITPRKKKQFHHIMPVLQQLHWFPVQFRNDSKLLLFTFKVIYYLVPPSSVLPLTQILILSLSDCSSNPLPQHHGGEQSLPCLF